MSWPTCTGEDAVPRCRIGCEVVPVTTCESCTPNPAWLYACVASVRRERVGRAQQPRLCTHSACVCRPRPRASCRCWLIQCHTAPSASVAPPAMPRPCVQQQLVCALRPRAAHVHHRPAVLALPVRVYRLLWLRTGCVPRARGRIDLSRFDPAATSTRPVSNVSARSSALAPPRCPCRHHGDRHLRLWRRLLQWRPCVVRGTVVRLG